MADISKIKNGNTTYNIKDEVARQGISYYVAGSGTAAVTASPFTAAKWVGTNENITALKTGLTINYKIGVAGNGTYGTLLNINSLGDHPVCANVNTMVSTRYPVGSIITLIYDADQTATAYNNSTAATTYTGVWKIADYDANTNTISYQQRHNSGTYKAKAAVYRYQLLFQTDELTLMPLNSVNNNTGTTKTMSTNEFNPFGQILYYSSTTNVSANGNIAAAALWDRYQLDLRYSLNCGSTLVAHKDVYLVAQPTSNGKVKMVSPYWTQELPTEKDKKVYIYLGHAYSAYQIELEPTHPIYYYNSGIKVWNGIAIENEYIINENLASVEGWTIRNNSMSTTTEEGDYYISVEKVLFTTNLAYTGCSTVKYDTTTWSPILDWDMAILEQTVTAYPNEQITVSFKVKNACRVYVLAGANSFNNTGELDTFDPEPQLKTTNTSISDYVQHSITFAVTENVVTNSWRWEDDVANNNPVEVRIQIAVRPPISTQPADSNAAWGASWANLPYDIRIKQIKVERSNIATDYSFSTDDLSIDNLTTLRDDYDVKISIQALARMIEDLQKNIDLKTSTSTLYKKIKSIEDKLS